MPSSSEHNPPEPPLSEVLARLRALRDQMASERPYDQQDALREVIASAAQKKVISFSTAARLEQLGWPPVGSDVAAAVRLAVADLVLCVVWEAIWPPDDQMGEMGGWIEDDGSVGGSPSPTAPPKGD